MFGSKAQPALEGLSLMVMCYVGYEWVVLMKIHQNKTCYGLAKVSYDGKTSE
jgi:hypothetical protein